MHDKALDLRDFQPGRSIRLALGRPFLKSKGTLPVLPVLMKASFIKNPIKLHHAQPSNTVNITV